MPSPTHMTSTTGFTPSAVTRPGDAGRFDPLVDVAEDGSPRVLAESEYHRAVLISHNRRDPAALKAG